MIQGRTFNGKVTQVMGPVVDVEFGEDHLPAIYNAVRIVDDGTGTGIKIDVTCEVDLPDEPHVGGAFHPNVVRRDARLGQRRPPRPAGAVNTFAHAAFNCTDRAAFERRLTDGGGCRGHRSGVEHRACVNRFHG